MSINPKALPKECDFTLIKAGDAHTESVYECKTCNQIYIEPILGEVNLPDLSECLDTTKQPNNCWRSNDG